MREFLIAGNWKMNGSGAASEELVAGIVSGVPSGSGFSLLVCPPFPYLASVASQVSGSAVKLGAQNVSEHGSGAYTGEVSGGMLSDVGCDYVIVGHSERRSLYGESSEQVAAKFMAAQAASVTPVLCVGETLEEREAGTTESVIDAQIQAVVDAAGIKAFAGAVIAYEPVWAIGTGMTATPEQAQDVHRHIREQLRKLDGGIADQLQILYGGSMKGENAAGLLSMPDIDGGLIGGASLKAND
ncbi:MAG: triose-phosphate isomerase, partial [Gammaproteobacteria bacterium]|nr:triose-phosphate isomerase [Gammaproteobacteria bacterium]